MPNQRSASFLCRAMERYPNNGKLLKVYGRFLEYVANDPWKATRYYSEAVKLGTEESLLSLAGSSAEEDVLKNLQGSKTEEGMGTVDEKVSLKPVSSLCYHDLPVLALTGTGMHKSVEAACAYATAYVPQCASGNCPAAVLLARMASVPCAASGAVKARPVSCILSKWGVRVSSPFLLG
eukprot:GHUV01043704.1.p1 GENE.GHUV01043704.1~~GHUV01043704.1.p1  ORF type:complete len:179 (+),score=27.03 GHUV01043704.1:253-789(+)